MSLRVRIALLVAAVVTVAVAAVGFLAVRSADAELTEEVDIDLLRRAEFVQDPIRLDEASYDDSGWEPNPAAGEHRNPVAGDDWLSVADEEWPSAAGEHRNPVAGDDWLSAAGEEWPSAAGEHRYSAADEDWPSGTSEDWYARTSEDWYEKAGKEWFQSLSEQFSPLSNQGDTLGVKLRQDPLGFLVSFDMYAQVVLALEDTVTRDGERHRIRGGEVVLRLDDDIGVEPSAETLVEVRDHGPVFETVARPAGGRWRGPLRVLTVEASDGVYVQLARSLDEVDRAVNDLTRRVLIFGLVAVGVAVAAAWYLAGRAVRPILRLADTAEYIAATGDLERPVDSSSSGEVGRLARSFRTMLAALFTSRRQQHRLVMDVSHELRTPLTSLRTNVDVLRRNRELPAEDQAAILEDLDMELVELSDLAAELVELASEVRTDEEPELVHLFELVEASAERARRRTGRDIDVLVERDAPVEGRPEALTRAIRNLVDNAVKFSETGSIQVEIDGGAVTVHDRGPGIPDTDRDRIFERFYRMEHQQHKPGSGLGLAIVKQVADAHGGTVSVSSSPLGGAAIGFRVPEIDD